MRQAVVVIHGMGEQRPMSFLRGLLGAAIGKSIVDETKYHSHPDKMSRSYELRRLLVEEDGERPQTEFYEYYWAHYMKANTLGDLTPRVKRLMFRLPWTVPGSMRLLWLILWAVAAFAAFAAYTWGSEVLFEDPNTLIKGINAGWLAAGAALTVGAVKGLLISHFADVTRYVNPAPRNVEIRQKIRSGAVDLLRELHKSGKYDRIVLLCHSLGSFVGLDALRELWHEVHQCHSGTTPATQEALEKLEGIGEDLKQETGNTMALRKEYREAQRALWQEQRAGGSPWLITDFVTAGSPLIGSTFLLAKNETELKAMQTARELPTCPPVLEVSRAGRKGYAFRWPSDSPLLLHQGATFAPVRWTNTWYPSRFGVFGDWFGGPLAPLYGRGIEDLPATKGKWTRFIPVVGHVRYFKWSDRTGLGTSIAAIRSGLALENSGVVDNQDNEIGTNTWLAAVNANASDTDWSPVSCANWQVPAPRKAKHPAGSGELYRRDDNKWAFRIKASNGQIVATDGGQGYESKSDAFATLEKMMGGGYDGTIEEV